MLPPTHPAPQMDEFTPDAVAKVSKACTSICMWVRAMYVYHNVALQVRGEGELWVRVCACWLGTRADAPPQGGPCM